MTTHVRDLASDLRDEDPFVRVEALNAFNKFILNIDMYNCLKGDFRDALAEIIEPLNAMLLDHMDNAVIAETAALSLAVASNPENYTFKSGLEEKIPQARLDLKVIFAAHNARNPQVVLNDAIYQFVTLAPGFVERPPQTTFTPYEGNDLILGVVRYTPN